MNKLPLWLLLASCVDAPGTETLSQEGKTDPPVLVDGGLKGEYLLRGHGIQAADGGLRNWHVGLIGTLAVTGGTAVLTYAHTDSRVHNLDRYTTYDACIVTPSALAARFGVIACTVYSDPFREDVYFDYVTSPDGNRAAFQGLVTPFYKAIDPAGEGYWESGYSAPLTVEATR